MKHTNNYILLLLVLLHAVTCPLGAFSQQVKQDDFKKKTPGAADSVEQVPIDPKIPPSPDVIKPEPGQVPLDPRKSPPKKALMEDFLNAENEKQMKKRALLLEQVLKGDISSELIPVEERAGLWKMLQARDTNGKVILDPKRPLPKFPKPETPPSPQPGTIIPPVKGNASPTLPAAPSLNK